MRNIGRTYGFCLTTGPVGQRSLRESSANLLQSGIGVISGWVCTASHIEIVIDEVATLAAAYGTDRGDTVGECGDADNGFGLLSTGTCWVMDSTRFAFWLME